MTEHSPDIKRLTRFHATCDCGWDDFMYCAKRKTALARFEDHARRECRLAIAKAALDAEQEEASA